MHWLHVNTCKYPSYTPQNLCLTLGVSKDDQENEDESCSYSNWIDSSSSRIISTFLIVLFLLKIHNPVVSSEFRNSLFSCDRKTLQRESISPETKLLPWLPGFHILSQGGGGWFLTASPRRAIQRQNPGSSVTSRQPRSAFMFPSHPSAGSFILPTAHITPTIVCPG